MEPNIQISMTAVLIAVVANFIFGAIWYMPLFGLHQPFSQVNFFYGCKMGNIRIWVADHRHHSP